MTFSNAELILIVNCLNAFSSGVIGPVLAAHMMNNGANHIIMGFLTGTAYICQYLSGHFVQLFEHGKKFTIGFCLYASVLSFFTTVFYSHWPYVFVSRLVYSLTNQILHYSKQYVARTEAEADHIKYYNLIDIVRVAGLSLGATLAGYIFVCNEDFAANALVSTVATLSAILVLQHVDDDDTQIHRPQSQLVTIPSSSYQKLKRLRHVAFRKHWDAVLLKTAYISGFTIFFSRYSFIIRFNYNVGLVVIGYSVAYQNLWLFAINFLVPFVRCKFSKKKKIFEHAILICSVVLAGLFYAPNYECFLMLLVPLFFTYSLVNSLLEEDVLGLGADPKVEEATQTLQHLVNVVGPVVFGSVCQVFGGYAFKLLTLMPSVVCVYIVNQRFLASRRGDVEEEAEVATRPKEE